MSGPPDPPKPAAFTMPPTRMDYGLPDGKIVQTFHNEASRMTIAELVLELVPPRHDLYWRRAGDSSYTAIGTLAAEQSLENAVDCATPWIFARIMQWTRRNGGYAGDPIGLVRIHLAGTPTVERVDLTDLLPGDARVSRLLRADDSGQRLDVVVLLMEPRPDGSGKRARRAVCVIDLATRSLKELDTLPGIEF